MYRAKPTGAVAMSSQVLPPDQLADVIEAHAATLVAALRNYGNAPPHPDSDAAPADAVAESGARSSANPRWRHVDVIDGFEAKWAAPPWWKAQGHAELHEHYGPMQVYEGDGGSGVVRIAVGAPQERLVFYGKERGWL